MAKWFPHRSMKTKSHFKLLKLNESYRGAFDNRSVITTDGTITEIPRDNYISEERVINDKETEAFYCIVEHYKAKK